MKDIVKLSFKAFLNIQHFITKVYKIQQKEGDKFYMIKALNLKTGKLLSKNQIFLNKR